MPVKKYRPITAGTRHRIGNSYAEITTNVPEKSLITAIKSTGGRNNYGRRAMRYIGGGHKKSFRIVDFKRDKHGVPAIVKSIEYDPNRSAFIALLIYKDGEKRYIIAPNGLKVGAELLSGETAPPEIGNALFLKDVPLGTIVHNIEMQPGKGGAIARSAGTNGQLTAREDRYATIKMPSGEVRKILVSCLATVGSTSNPDHNQQQMGKAGRNRWKGIRPRNRGVAMNPVDHPMGGGEGKASGGHPRSRKGLLAKGLKTRNKKKTTSKLIISRRKK